MFWMVLTCTLLDGVVPTPSWIPKNRYAAVVPVVVQAVPPALGALPPMKLPTTVKLLPEVALMRMGRTEAATAARPTVW